MAMEDYCQGCGKRNCICPLEQLPLLETKTISRCKNASRYRGLRFPTCNGGNPCLACLRKWENHK